MGLIRLARTAVSAFTSLDAATRCLWYAAAGAWTATGALLGPLTDDGATFAIGACVAVTLLAGQRTQAGTLRRQQDRKRIVEKALLCTVLDLSEHRENRQPGLTPRDGTDPAPTLPLGVLKRTN